jgi:phosphopantothenoylcysteine decarboxylase/phosphopantothenate--cysteine ligase
MGYALAAEARDRGAHVILISGPATLPVPYGIELYRVETAQQMRDTVYRSISDADALVMSAAVADFRPAQSAAQKIKKNSSELENLENGGELSIRLVQNPDILGELASSLNEQTASQPCNRRLVRVGFAAETEQLVVHAQEKLRKKQLDLLIANDVSRSDSGFGSDTNKVTIFHAHGAMEDLPVMSKTSVATAIWDRIVSLLSTGK